MKIDGRKTNQRFKGVHGKDIYVWKSKGKYSVGVNGTSTHDTNLEKHQAETLLTSLLIKNTL